MSEPGAGETRIRGRAEQRRERRRRQVRRIAALLAVLGVLAVAFAVWLAADAQGPTPTPEQSPVRTQSTLLWAVQAPDGTGAAAALLAHDPEGGQGAGEGAVVLLPPQVLVNVPGSGSVPFGRAVLTAPAESTRDALSDLVGVTVDDSWVLTADGLRTLVDALGGVPVDVDVPVLSGSQVLVSPGAQELDGARAYAFLTFLGEGDQEQSRLARVQEVLDGLLTVLPTEEPELATVLDTLGERSDSSLSSTELAALLQALAAADDEAALQYDVLPVVDLDPGGGVVAFRLDEEANRAVVDRLFAGSVPAGARDSGNRVIVYNGVGTPGLGEAVRRKLAPEGFVLVDSRNAPRFGYAETQVLVPAATAEAQELGERVAEALGVPATSVATQELGTVADVAVLVGADFSP